MKTTRCVYLASLAISLVVMVSNTIFADDQISVELVGGTVRHRWEFGSGPVNGVAKITNHTSRSLNAVTLMVSYAQFEIPYGGPKRSWRYHKCKFSPPIPPGGSRNVKWHDAEGYHGVYLDYAKPEWGQYLPSVWVGWHKIPCEIVQGRLYVAAQPMMIALGGTCEKDSVPGQKILKINDQVITATIKPIKAGDDSLMPAKDFKNRSYVPLAELAKRLSSNIAYAKDTNKYMVSTPSSKPGTKIGDVCVNPKDGAEMVWVPAGEFLMGSTDGQIAAVFKDFAEWSKEKRQNMKFDFDAEKPQRKVYLGGYWMYKNEVTVAQYKKFCKEANREMPSAPKWGWLDNHPMVNVTWQDAVDYSKWACASLPTEAQWEKAARGTDGQIYPWGNKWDASKCASSAEKELKSTQPVGSYSADLSPFGCVDMAGNVCEWCADWYDPNYYKSAPTKNPSGPSNGVTFTIPNIGDLKDKRVLRGGSWTFRYDNFYRLRCAFRNLGRSPDYRDLDYGFRCARTP